MPFQPRVIEARSNYFECYDANRANPDAARTPKGEVLDGVTLSNTMGLLAQLGQLAKFVTEVFDGLARSSTQVFQRLSSADERIQKIKRMVPTVREKLKRGQPLVDPAAPPWKCRQIALGALFLPHTRPASLEERRARAQAPPALHRFDRFRTDGKSSAKAYSNPDFFQEAWLADEMARMREDKRIRDEKRRQKRQKKKLLRHAAKKEREEVKLVTTKKYNADGSVQVLEANAPFKTTRPKQLARTPSAAAVRIRSLSVSQHSNSNVGPRASTPSMPRQAPSPGGYIRSASVDTHVSLPSHLSAGSCPPPMPPTVHESQPLLLSPAAAALLPKAPAVSTPPALTSILAAAAAGTAPKPPKFFAPAVNGATFNSPPRAPRDSIPPPAPPPGRSKAAMKPPAPPPFKRPSPVFTHASTAGAGSRGAAAAAPSRAKPRGAPPPPFPPPFRRRGNGVDGLQDLVDRCAPPPPVPPMVPPPLSPNPITGSDGGGDGLQGFANWRDWRAPPVPKASGRGHHDLLAAIRLGTPLRNAASSRRPPPCARAPSTGIGSAVMQMMQQRRLVIETADSDSDNSEWEDD